MPENENIGAGMSGKDIGAELYEKWLGGDETAFDKIMDIYHDALIFFVYGTVKNFADAEDIAADAFAELIVHKKQILLRLLAENLSFLRRKKQGNRQTAKTKALCRLRYKRK